jgi:hypothetical protein
MAVANILENKLKQVSETFRQIEKDYMYDDPKIGLEKFKVIKQLLAEILKDISGIKKEAILQRQNMLAAESTPVSAKNIAGNTALQTQAPQLAGLVVEKKKSLLSDDLDMLIKRMYEGKFKFNEDKFNETTKARQEYLAKSFVNNGVGGIIRGLQTAPKIKTRRTIGEILTAAAKDSKVLQRLEEKKSELSANHKFFRVIQNVRKLQKKKKGSSFMGTAASFITGRLINNLITKIKFYVDAGVSSIKGVIASTKFGRQILNETTKLSGRIKGGVSLLSKVVKGGFDVVSIGGKVISSVLKSAIPTAAVFYLTGGSVPVAITYLTVSTGVKTVLDVLKSPHLSSIGFIRDAQIKWGRGLFYDTYGRIKAGSLDFNDASSLTSKAITTNPELLGIGARLESQNALGILDSRFFQSISSIDAVLSWAPIGAAVAGILGVSPIVGGLIGGIGGLGLRALTDSIQGGKISLEIAKNTFKGGAFIKALAQFPATEFYGHFQTNVWFGTQLDLLKNKYHGNFEKYWRENWNPFYDANIFKTFLAVSNWIMPVGAGISVLTGVMGTSLIRVTSAIFNTPYLSLGRNILSLAGLSSRAVTLSTIVGTVIGITAAVLLGIPIGPGMLLGATIGGIVGTIAGLGISALISAATGGIGAFLSFVITTTAVAIGTTIGSWIGSWFDKAVGFSGGMMMNFLQGMLALFQMLMILKQKISLDNVMPIAIGLITLMGTLYRMGVFDTSNQCLEDQYCPLTAPTTGLNDQPDLLELKAFGVYLISPQNSVVDSDTLGLITSYLNNNGIELQNKFNAKTIFINLLGTESFINEQFVILGIDINSNNSAKAFSDALDVSVNNVANTQTSQETNYAFLNIK